MSLDDRIREYSQTAENLKEAGLRKCIGFSEGFDDYQVWTDGDTYYFFSDFYDDELLRYSCLNPDKGEGGL